MILLRCIWCLQTVEDVAFKSKAHTIPKSLGGQNYNRNVCDECNSYFGNKLSENYSIEEALKETFNITRRRLLYPEETKRQIGKFKSRFFEIKERKGKPRLSIKPSFRLNYDFQNKLCRAFKRGLYKMYLEEINRQKDLGYDSRFNIIREFARYDKGDLPVFYFNRSVGMMITFKREAETPILCFDRMKYLFSNDEFAEIEFLGHVFGFPTAEITSTNFREYIKKSMKLKELFFESMIVIDKLTDIDLTLAIMNDKGQIN